MALGVLSSNDGLINFCGDDFDRIYCKYLARNREVTLQIRDIPLSDYLSIRLHSYIRRMNRNINRLGLSEIGTGGTDRVRNCLEALLANGDADPFESTPGIASELYWLSVTQRSHQNMEVAIVTIDIPSAQVTQYYSLDDSAQGEQRPLDEINSLISTLSERVADVGGTVEVEIPTFDVVPVEILANQVTRTVNHQIRNNISHRHIHRMVDAHVKQRDTEESLFHGELAFRYNPDRYAPNNLGYLYLV